MFSYSSTGTCQTLDTLSNTLTNGFTNLPLQASGLIHDSYTNGFYVQVSLSTCYGTDCGVYSGPWIWKLGTNKVWPLAEKQFTGGHNSLSHSYLFNTSNPSVWEWPLSTFIGKQIGKMTPPCCTDNHIEADVKIDTNPVLGTSAGVNGEVFGMAQNGTLFRFCKTYSSASTATNFWGEWGIGASSQDRTIYAFTSDMQGQLGVYSDGGKTWNRTDVFLCGLVGQ